MALIDKLRTLIRARPTLADGDIPTADLYFRYALADLIGPDGPIRQIGPFTYATDEALVMIRYATEFDLAEARRRRPRLVYYVIDDIIPRAGEAADLPPAYAAKLARFAREVLPRIIELRPVVLAPSAATLATFPGVETRAIAPSLPYRINADERLNRASPGPLSVCFLGTRSHAECLPLLESIARRLVAQVPGARLTLYWGRTLPRSMAAIPSIENRDPMSWPAFRDHMRQQRFDIALAPLQDSVFNLGRSFNKVLDHALVGAAGIYSRKPPFDQVVTDGVEGLLAGDDAEAWCGSIERLSRDVSLRQRVARNGIALANSIADPATSRRQWLDWLGLTEAAANGDGRGAPRSL